MSIKWFLRLLLLGNILLLILGFVFAYLKRPKYIKVIKVLKNGATDAELSVFSPGNKGLGINNSFTISIEEFLKYKHANMLEKLTREDLVALGEPKAKGLLIPYYTYFVEKYDFYQIKRHSAFKKI